MSSKLYWEESVGDALCEAGLWDSTTPEQRERLVSILQGCAEMESEYSGACNIPNPSVERAEKAEKALKIEMSKVHCRECSGNGRIISNFGFRSSDSQCWKCHGEGKHLP